MMTVLGELANEMRCSREVREGWDVGIHRKCEESRSSARRMLVYCASRTVGSTKGAMVGVQPIGGWKRSGSRVGGAGGPYYLFRLMRAGSRSTYT